MSAFSLLLCTDVVTTKGHYNVTKKIPCWKNPSTFYQQTLEKENKSNQSSYRVVLDLAQQKVQQINQLSGLLYFKVGMD